MVIENLPGGGVRVLADVPRSSMMLVDVPEEQERLCVGRLYPDSEAGIETAAIELRGAVDAVARLVASCGPSSVEVIGCGVLAGMLLRDLDKGHSQEHRVIVDASGSALEVARALSSARPLATLVLPAPMATRVVLLPTYSDIHVRGLTVIGVPWKPAPSGATAAAADVELLRSRSQPLPSGAEALRGKTYRIQAT